MLVVGCGCEQEHEAHPCVIRRGSWPAPGSLQESVWLRLKLLMWPQRCSWLWQVKTFVSPLTPARRSSPSPRLKLRSQHPDVQRSRQHPRGPWPPNLLFMALWPFLSICVFSGPAHVGERCDYRSATAQHTEGQLWGKQGPQNHVVMSVNMGQW